MTRAQARRLAAVVAAFWGAFAAAWPVEVLQQAGPAERRIDLLVLGDGYREADQAKLSDDARAVIEGLFAVAPFSDYRGLFNVRLVHVVSRQTGADGGAYGADRDTALGARFGCNGVPRLLCVDPRAAVTTAVQSDAGHDLLIVVVNDPTYGGSGGDLTVLSTHAAAVDLLRHELSHALALLADEYEAPYDFPPCDARGDCAEPNATLHAGREGGKWAAWIDPQTPVPSSEGLGLSSVGLFEGCRYRERGVFRATDQGCLMRELGSGSFCPVCREGLVRAFWRRVDPIDAVSPPLDAPVSVCAAPTFAVSHPEVAHRAWWYLWSVDGVPVAGDSARFSLGAQPALSSGRHTVTVLAQDRTPLVRSDPAGLLSQSVSWTVEGCASGACVEAASCVGGQCQRTPRPAGLACEPRACEGGVRYATGTCDGRGDCVGVVVGDCGGYACDDAGGACRTGCSEANHCAPGVACVEGACVTEVPPPGACGSCSGAPGAVIGWGALVALGALRRRRAARRA